MYVFKCKMCGGKLEINNNESVVECEYCGTQQTLPKLNDERKANLYDRANHFRRNNEFDKAEGIYEQILNEDNTDAEAYWSLLLCRYGIEYVEDPATHKRVQTVNRAQFTSVFDDDNYKSALQYADLSQKVIYEKEAREINEIQKGILAISQKEESFDVFICYKETDSNGRRTPDSVLANDLYHQLTQEGFKVFFSRITLEDKLGSAYEPYIFAALNSAKVMVVLGTKQDFFNAVWVKNEWSRYLALIKQGEKKILIPAYKDMDPYDLPEEFSHLQAQDMSRLGFMQDLIRGIKKVAQAETQTATIIKEKVITGSNANTAPLLRRAFMFLEDEDWESANEYCEKVLDMEPENATAYLGKLMVELKAKTRDELKHCMKPYDDRSNYQKVIRFADEKLKDEINGYISFIKDRNTQRVKEDLERVFILLKDGDFNSANKYCDGILYFEPENATAYLGKLMAELGVKTREEFKNCTQLFDDRSNYQKVIRFGDKKLIDEINEYIPLIKERIIQKAKADFQNSFEKMQIRNYQKSIAAGHWWTVGLITDGTVVATEVMNYCKKIYNGQCEVSSWRDIVAISTGRSHTIGLKSNGTVVATKYMGDKENYEGQCEVSSWRDIVAISAGDANTVGLKSDGTVVATKYMGDKEYYEGQCEVSSWKDIVAISTGEEHTVGLKSDGTVVATKYMGDKEDYCEQCEVSSWKDIVAISAGCFHTVGLKYDGTVLATGSNYDGQCEVSSWENIVAISAGDYYTVGLKSDGTVVATKYIGNKENYEGQCEVSSWENIVAISAGDRHTVGLKSDGTVVATEYMGLKEVYGGQCEVSDWRDVAIPILADTKEEFMLLREKRMQEQKRLQEQRLEKQRLEEQRLEAQRRFEEHQRTKYREAKVCQYCGGTFEGFFSKKCIQCGKKKDY